MIGYPYTYNDSLSEQKAMMKIIEIFDKGVIFCLFWLFCSLILMSAVSYVNNI